MVGPTLAVVSAYRLVTKLSKVAGIIPMDFELVEAQLKVGQFDCLCISVRDQASSSI